ncbi:MAG: transposase [Atopobiaceae bacterium]|nr:transposase [Atopobiaceae bacterium]
MPHTARKKSESGYYHVVPKGIGNQILFLDDADRVLYLRLLDEAASEQGLGVIAYCLMSNHVHLVLDDPNDHLANMMKHVDEAYATHLAEKIGRRGGILVKPFWSEPIESDSYLLCAVRYVHANPAAAGICRASAYEWSSVKDYLGRDGFTSAGMVLDMLGGRDGFIEFSAASNSTAAPFPGSRLRGHLLDEEAVRVARDILGFDASELPSKEGLERGNAIRLLHDRGLSTRQIMRISGLGQYDIAKHLRR